MEVLKDMEAHMEVLLLESEIQTAFIRIQTIKLHHITEVDSV